MKLIESLTTHILYLVNFSHAKAKGEKIHAVLSLAWHPRGALPLSVPTKTPPFMFVFVFVCARPTQYLVLGSWFLVQHRRSDQIRPYMHTYIHNTFSWLLLRPRLQLRLRFELYQDQDRYQDYLGSSCPYVKLKYET